MRMQGDDCVLNTHSRKYNISGEIRFTCLRALYCENIALQLPDATLLYSHECTQSVDDSLPGNIHQMMSLTGAVRAPRMFELYIPCRNTNRTHLNAKFHCISIMNTETCRKLIRTQPAIMPETLHCSFGV